MGFQLDAPFAGLIPRTGGLFARRCSRFARAKRLKDTRVLRRDLCSADGISAGPGPRAVRRRSSAPICFRRGDRPLVEKSEICKSDRPGMSARFDFWASLPSAVRRRGTRRPRRRSCLGLCLSQGCRTRAASHEDDRATGRARPRFRITSLRARARTHTLSVSVPYPLVGFSGSSLRRGLPGELAAGPFSVLMGLMPVRPDPDHAACFRPTPCLRFRTVRERVRCDSRSSSQSSRRGAQPI